jgi:hypothetical protein
MQDALQSLSLQKTSWIADLLQLIILGKNTVHIHNLLVWNQ